MKKIIVIIICIVCAIGLYAQNSQQARQWDPRSTEWYTPVPPKVQPGNAPGQPPADAIILFDGKDLSKWESANRDTIQRPPVKIEGGVMYLGSGTGNIRTKEYFGDCQLHIEFKSPPAKEYKEQHKGQHRGNSGIIMQSRYEIQVLDGDDNPTYVNGMVGSIYKQSAPLVNAYTKNGEWQVYDIYWKAPVFNGDGTVASPAIATVVLNGIVIQNNFVLKGGTPFTGLPVYTPHGRMPLLLQDHNDGTSVAFRNIWIRNL